MSVMDASERSNLIIIAEVLRSGRFEPGAPNQVYRNGVEVRVLETLAGTHHSRLSLFVTATVYPADVAEQLPQVGERYICLINDRNDRQRIVQKMLLPSPENLKQIRRAVER